MSLGTAFENLSRGLGMAYFPAISLSFKESVAFNFGSRPLRYHFGKVAEGGLASRIRVSLPQQHRGLVARLVAAIHKYTRPSSVRLAQGQKSF